MEFEIVLIRRGEVLYSILINKYLPDQILNEEGMDEVHGPISGKSHATRLAW